MNNSEKYARGLKWTAATLLAALAAGCGGGGKDPVLGGGDILAALPTVTLTSPAAAATNVAVTTNVTATFSKNMNTATIIGANFTLACQAPCTSSTVAVTYDVAKKQAIFNPSTPTGVLDANTEYTATVTTVAKDTAGLALANPFVWKFTTAGDTVSPTVGSVFPNASALPPSTACTAQVVNATFSEPMNKATVEASGTFTLQASGPPLGASLGGAVTYDIATRVATFTPTAPLLAGNYTATISPAAKDLAGNPLVLKTWTFVATGAACVPPPVASTSILASAARYGTFGGTAGMTNQGTQTLITGAGGTTADIGTIATATSSITGFQDSAMDVYTVVPGVNQGIVTGKILSCTTSVTGPTNPTNGVNAASCALATQARLDAQAAYLALEAMPDSALNSVSELSGLTLAPGVYKSAGGSYLIKDTDLTLDAQGNPNAIFVFQMASSLTVGASGAPRNIILKNGALAKNVFWQVGSAATINPGGGGTMVGTIIAQEGVVFSTHDSVIPLLLNGRALSLGASVTMVNTIITVPAP